MLVFATLSSLKLIESNAWKCFKQTAGYVENLTEKWYDTTTALLIIYHFSACHTKVVKLAN